MTCKRLMSKRRAAVYSFYFGDAVGGGGFMYSQIEAIKMKYATGRFVSWRDLKADAINQRWLLSLYVHCRHFHPVASVLQWANDCLVVVEFFFMMFEDDGGDF